MRDRDIIEINNDLTRIFLNLQAYSVLSMQVSLSYWIGFHILIFLMLALDLGVFNKKAHKILMKEAVIWTSVWIALALLFNLFILLKWDDTKALEFLTGYVIEKSLSVDNIFVFILIFSYFNVKDEYQHRILFWGIVGALVMRAVFIFTGVALIHRFEWIIIVFGVFLIYTGIRMALHKHVRVDPANNPLVKLVRKYFPVTGDDGGGSFFVRINHRIYATPMFLVLLVIESSDLIFAVDSIPAILAITQDTFIVYTSNIFAILGLRALYFVVAGMMNRFRYLKVGLSLILTYVGLKMLASFFGFHIPVFLSLLIIVFILTVFIAASLIIKEKKSSFP